MKKKAIRDQEKMAIRDQEKMDRTYDLFAILAAYSRGDLKIEQSVDSIRALFIPSEPKPGRKKINKTR